MKVESRTLVPDGTAYAIDKDISGIMLLRMDVMAKDWSDPIPNRYGLKTTTRFGIGISRSNAYQK
jgi:hypothetical protein